MHRNLFFINTKAEIGETATVPASEAGHLGKVLRKKAGDLVQLSDGETRWYVAKIQEIRKEHLTVEILEVHLIQSRTGLKVVLVIGLPKRPSMELILQKATELGVDTIIPVRTAYAFMKNLHRDTMNRWQRIVREAAKQSGRHRLMRIAPVRDWHDLFRTAFSGLRMILHEAQDATPLQDVLSRLKEKEVTACIGPEGGFTPLELAEAEQNGFHRICLGSQVLRTETAAIALSAILRYASGGIKPQEALGEGNLP